MLPAEQPDRRRRRGAQRPAPSSARAAGTLSAAALVLCINAGASAQGQQPEPVVPSAPAAAPTDEDKPYEGRPVREIRFEGLKRVQEPFVRTQLRSQAGRPLSWLVVREDLRRLERLGEFRDIQADVKLDDAMNVIIIFRVVEAPIVSDVVVVGNRQISDEEIRSTVSGVISLTAGVPIDRFQIGRSQRAIEELYRAKGYYQAQVSVDESELESSGIITFRVREGERLKVTAIRFSGNNSYSARLLQPNIRTTEAGWLDTGALDDQVLDGDVAALQRFYLDRGYLDVRTSRQVQPAPNGREAIVTFLVDEGPQYTLRAVRVETGGRDAGAPEVFSADQLTGLVKLKPGDVFGAAALRTAVDTVRDAYRQLGYVDARVDALERRDPDAPVVDMTIIITEGRRFRAGMVYIQGNDLTQQKVVRRQVDVKPERWLDGTAVTSSEKRLKESGLFRPESVKATIQPEDPSAPGQRDVLVEVEEGDTGSLGFGAAVGSDSGLIGAITLTQRNFDIADTPDSFDEFIRGRAFRGAGQSFNLTISPGTEQSTYSLGLTEPALFDSEYALGGTIYDRVREYDEYDEDRLGGRVRLGRRFGTRWTGGLAMRVENVEISGVSSTAAEDYQEVEGDNVITSISGDLTRSTVDARFRPTTGTHTDVGVEQVGALGGDYSFTKLALQHQVFLTVDEDELGRKTVLSFKGSIGYIPQIGEAPVYEKLYLGGRNFRGFKYRGVGPVGNQPDGTPTDDHVGGNWSFFLGTEIEKPLWKDVLAGVIFVDSGTVTEELEFAPYRLSVGAGVRLYIPQLGQAPLAFDFGFPLLQETSDRNQTFSFSVDIPIR